LGGSFFAFPCFGEVGLLSRFWGAKPVGYVWGHEGFGGAFAPLWTCFLVFFNKGVIRKSII
jgi:hypothetical protein